MTLSPWSLQRPGASPRALVTGGAGFIGSHLVDWLLRDGWRVTVLDNFTDALYGAEVKWRNTASHLTHPAYSLVKADIRDLGACRRRLSDSYDVVVHLAAMAGVPKSMEYPLLYEDVNVAGTANVLELARGLEVPQFVFASSSSVYGDNPNAPWRESDLDLRPRSKYAQTKIDGEQLGRDVSARCGMRFVALRFFTVYGPRQRPDLVVHEFLRRMYAGAPVQLCGDGTSSRDYTHVGDIVRGIEAAMRYDGSACEVFNLGSDRPVSLNDLVRALSAATGIDPVVEHVPERPGDVPHTWASLEKSCRLLGYEPRVALADGLRESADWMRELTARRMVG